MTYDYDMIVIGGGAAGLTAAGISANFGAKTLMVERHRLGGDCTWTGCIPSKTLLHAATLAHSMHEASESRLIDQQAAFDFGALMRHVRSVRQEVYEDADAPHIFEAMGVEVREGEACFVDPHTVAITDADGTHRLSSRYFVIAAGSRATVPPIDGLDGTPYLTNESLFEIEAQPERLAIIGAGPIGTEMAQAFQRLGTQVTVLERGETILGKDDPELSSMLLKVLRQDGVTYHFDADVQRVTHEDSTFRIEAKLGDSTQTVEADALLVATGRTPNLDALDLDAAGVAYTDEGITVDKRCRTSQRHIYAAGDVTGRYQFTHMSEHMAKTAATNALLKLPSKMDTEHVPWVTYVAPELAHVGASEQQLLEQGTAFREYRFPYNRIDRAITEGKTTGLIKVFATRWRGKILGVSILGAHAGELICEYVLAMRNGVSLRAIADTIHPYPTYGLGARRAADQWYVRKQSTTLVRVLQTLFGYRGPVIEPDPDRVV